MALLHSLKARWRRLRETAHREFLRDPNVILFERGVEPGQRGEASR
ncbi:hypothetical protein [Sphingobium sp.]|jgi:hypothetical protein